MCASVCNGHVSVPATAPKCAAAIDVDAKPRLCGAVYAAASSSAALQELTCSSAAGVIPVVVHKQPIACLHCSAGCVRMPSCGCADRHIVDSL